MSEILTRKYILVTGVAGFIGSALAKSLNDYGLRVIGIDNLNDYYDKNLKMKRLSSLLSIDSKIDRNFIFKEIDIRNKRDLTKIFRDFEIDYVYHLAAQAGVRNSFLDPASYFECNIEGTFNILELAKANDLKRIFFSSTSSVYGNNANEFFSETHSPDAIQFYASTKIIAEQLIESYCNFFNLNATVFRFFTVYGPWGRPDMSIFKFTEAISRGERIDVFNFGNHTRSFTYIDDVVYFLIRALQFDSKLENGYSLFNLGNPNTVKLEYIIELISTHLNLPVEKNYLPLQKGDIFSTAPNVDKLMAKFGNFDFTQIEVGILKFLRWYKDFSK